MKPIALFRRLTAVVLALLTLATSLLLSSCGDTAYEQIPSTDEEKSTVLTMGEHNVPYELFRAFFINRKTEVDKGDDSVWTGENAPYYFDKITPLVLEDIAAVYAVLDLAEEMDIDPYGEAVEDELNEQIAINVDGGVWNGVNISGCGSYEAYLSSLAESHMNDGAARLLLRYQICENKLLDLLTTPYTSKYSYTEDDLQFFFSDDKCQQFVLLYREANTLGLTAEENRTLVDNALVHLRAANDTQTVVDLSKQYFHNSIDEIKNGTFLTRFALGKQLYGEILDAAFSLEVGEFSHPISVSTATQDFLYVIHRVEKDKNAYATRAEEIEELYLCDRFYTDVATKEATLLQNVTYTDFYRSLIGKSIVYP